MNPIEINDAMLLDTYLQCTHPLVHASTSTSHQNIEIVQPVYVHNQGDFSGNHRRKVQMDGGTADFIIRPFLTPTVTIELGCLPRTLIDF